MARETRKMEVGFAVKVGEAGCSGDAVDRMTDGHTEITPYLLQDFFPSWL